MATTIIAHPSKQPHKKTLIMVLGCRNCLAATALAGATETLSNHLTQVSQSSTLSGSIRADTQNKPISRSSQYAARPAEPFKTLFSHDEYYGGDLGSRFGHKGSNSKGISQIPLVMFFLHLTSALKHMLHSNLLSSVWYFQHHSPKSLCWHTNKIKEELKAFQP